MRLIDIEAVLLDGMAGTGGAGCGNAYQTAIHYTDFGGNSIYSKTISELQKLNEKTIQTKKDIPAICSHCGAPTNPNLEKCAYCDVYY